VKKKGIVQLTEGGRLDEETTVALFTKKWGKVEIWWARGVSARKKWPESKEECVHFHFSHQ
jgi:hypothetical protein